MKQGVCRLVGLCENNRIAVLHHSKLIHDFEGCFCLRLLFHAVLSELVLWWISVIRLVFLFKP